MSIREAVEDATVAEAKKLLEDADRETLEAALEAEEQGKNRKTLRRFIENRLDAYRSGTSSAAPGSAATGGDTFSLTLGVKQVMVLSFAIGLLVGGFGTVLTFNMTGLTGAAVADTNQDTDNQQPSGDDGNDAVTIPEDAIADDPSIGPSDAPVTIIEYSDYGCPWCAEWAGVDVTPRSDVNEQHVLEQIKENYINDGKVRFVYADYPVPRLHPNAPQAHIAANCILQQGEDLYWEFHNSVFERRGEWTKRGGDAPQATFTSIAENIGADTGAMQTCIDNSNGEEYKEDKQQIQDADGGLGTPTFFIGNAEEGYRKLSGARPYSDFETVIETILN